MKITAGISDRVHSGRYRNEHIPALGYTEPYGYTDPKERVVRNIHQYLDPGNRVDESPAEFRIQEKCVQRFYDWLRRT
ncbi:MAG: hypothetical protein M1346_01135 [Gammaproteobacteria bacterium]|nr:hypothetical protein [Gammaproteobacteria bacterium]